VSDRLLLLLLLLLLLRSARPRRSRLNRRAFVGLRWPSARTEHAPRTPAFASENAPRAGIRYGPAGVAWRSARLARLATDGGESRFRVVVGGLRGAEPADLHRHVPVHRYRGFDAAVAGRT
jgi:hypothetical protein